MAPTRRVVFDLLKPHDPSMLELADRIADLEGIDGVNATLLELDREVQNVKLTVEGTDVDFAAVEDAIEDLGASAHSIDQVIAGGRVVEDVRTPQD
jgi:hypothetical protein